MKCTTRIARYEPWLSQSDQYYGTVIHDPHGGRWVTMGPCPEHPDSVLIMSLMYADLVECSQPKGYREEIHIDEPDA